MVAARTNMFLTLVAAWCALFAAIEVSATYEKPVMWILAHHKLKQARIDPIVTPGKPSSHVHSLVGANGVSEDTTTADDLVEASNCTTSGLTSDMSAYWAPTLYNYNSNNDTFSPQPLDYVNTYYLMRGNVNITAFPRGLQLLAGNATRRSLGPTKQADNTVSFVCLNYKDGSSQWPTFPPGPCPQGLRTQVVFPSCWNGKDLVSADHSHVVYPLGNNADNGQCPDSHNVRLPTLFYEFVWGVHNTDNSGNSTWVLSNGDAIGYSFHADFIAAWNVTVLQEAIDTCAGNLFNGVENCPPLNATLDRAGARACTAVSTEAVTGSIASLPGCNMVWNGPHAGKGLTPGCDPNKVMLKPANWTSSSNTSTSTASSNSTSSSLAAASSTASSSAVESTPLTSTASNNAVTSAVHAAGSHKTPLPVPVPKVVTSSTKPINKAPSHQHKHVHVPKKKTKSDSRRPALKKCTRRGQKKCRK